MRAPKWLRTTLADAIEVGKSPRSVLWGLVLLALGMRLARLGFQPLWWDEGWSLYFAATDLRTMLELTAVDIHPPFYYLLLHLWTALFGPGAGSVRMLSVLIGTATVPLLYLTGRRSLGSEGGLLAAFLLAISPFHIYYSQEVRMYGLVALLGLGAYYFTLRWTAGNREDSLEKSVRSRKQGTGVRPARLPTTSRAVGSLTNGVGYVLAATAALYTQYYAGFLLLGLNLVVLIGWWRARRPLRKLVPWLGAQVVVAVLYLPWVLYAADKLVAYVRFKVSVEQDLSLGLFTYLARHLAAFTWGHAEGLLAEWWWAGLLPLALLLLCLALLLTLRSRKQGIRGGGWGMADSSFVILVISLICGFAVNLGFPFTPPRSERLLLLALPAYLLSVTAGLLILWRRRRAWAAVVVVSLVMAAVVSLGFFYSVPRYPDDDYRTIVGQVRALGLPSDAVVCVHPWQVGYFQAYIPDDDVRPTLVLTPREVIPIQQQLWADDPARMAADLDVLLAKHGRLWFPDHRAMGRVLEKRIEAHLVDHTYPVLREWHGENTVLSLFATGEPEPQPVKARFAEWLTLESAALSPGPLEANWGFVAVDLAWQLSEQPAEAHTVGLRLVGPTGHVWAQRDAPPRGGLEPFSQWPIGEPGLDRHGLLVPAGTPPGEYSLTLRVYRSEDVTLLPVTFEAGSDGEMTLGTVRVIRPQVPPPVEALTFEQPLQVDLGDRLRLLGFNVYNDSALLPGEVVAVELFWQALADPGEDFLPRLQLLDPEGQAQAELTEKPVAGTYPTAWWQAGELVRDPHALPIPAVVLPGRYRLTLSLVRAADGGLVEIKQGQTAVELAEIEVQGREHRYQPTVPEHSQVARFGSSVELIGYDLREAVRAPGSPLEVTFHWHVLETPDRNYHTFVHLLDTGDGIVAQHDGPPAGGELPTLGWLPGEYLTDTHHLQVPCDLPDGGYRLGVGLYDPVTGDRLGERVILDERIERCPTTGD